MRTRHFRSLLSCFVAALCAPAAHGQIQWAASLEKAKADKLVIFVAMNMDGERANDEMLDNESGEDWDKRLKEWLDGGEKKK